MTARPDTGTGRDTRAHVAAGRHTTTATTKEDPMSTTSNPHHDDYQALLIERFGPIKELTRERAATPAEVIRLPQRRRNEQRKAAA